MDRETLREALDAAFDAESGELDAVVRAAGDLADSGRLDRDLDATLTADDVVGNLRDAPRGGLAERWNWWMGSLGVAFGGYRRFEVRRWASGERTGRP